MSIDPVVRPAGRDDLGSIFELDAQARAQVADQRGGGAWLAEHVAARSIGEEEFLANTWVATIDEQIVGFLRCVIEPVLGRGLICTVDRVFVHEQARELGFGDALLQAAIERAVELSCQAFEGNALPGDRETKNLYERAGITARKIVVSRVLGPR